MKSPESNNTAEVSALFYKCIPLFDAWGDPTRQKIILMLGEDESLNVNQIAERLPLSRPAISHHLRILREAGLLSVTRKGTENFYELDLDDSLGLLKDLIQKVEQACQ